MSETNFSATPERAGKQYRSNPDRYFHVMAEGWYVFTREGVRGPFYDKSNATNFLAQHIDGDHTSSDPSASWRL